MSAHAGSAAPGADLVTVELDAIQLDRAAGVGRVVDAGAHGDSLLGKRVLVGPIDPCGECEVCRRGGAAVCPLAVRRDALDARAQVAARWLVPLDDGLALEAPAAAAVAGDVVLAYTLYARTGIGPRDPVVVVGASPIARFLVEILRAKGIAPVVVAPPGAWADWLASRGVAVAADRDALVAAFDAKSLGTKPWRVLCADASATREAAALAGPRAVLTLLADRASSAAIDAELLAREVTIVGVAGAHPDLVVEVAAMCAKGEVDLAAGTRVDGDDALRTRVRAM